MTRPAGDWWKSFFKPSVFPIEALTAGGHAAEEVRSVLKVLRLARGASVLDVPCGAGRHAVLLARRGFDVTGVDLSRPYLAAARRAAAKARPAPRFLRRDMRTLGFDREFDAAVCLWTSFGYFRTPAEDVKSLRSMRAALKPGGRLVLDVIDGSRFLRGGVPRRHWALAGRVWVLEENRLLSGGDPALVTDRIYLHGGRRGKTTTTFVRLYDRRRLTGALRRAGFSAVRVLGRGLRSGQDSGTRLLAVATR